jgi:hypothetical protein
MRQRGQVLELKTKGRDGQRLWAYRYRPGGRDSKRLQHGGFTSAEAASAELERAINRAERRRLHSRALTLGELADEYLAQHDAQPETPAKLRWLLSKSIAVFGMRSIVDLEAREIARWRMALPGIASRPPRHCVRSSPALSRGGCSRPIRPRSASTTRRPSGARCCPLSRASYAGSPKRSARDTGRWCSSPPRRACARASGSRLSGATSIRTRAHCMSGEVPDRPGQDPEDQRAQDRAATARGA